VVQVGNRSPKRYDAQQGNEADGHLRRPQVISIGGVSPIIFILILVQSLSSLFLTQFRLSHLNLPFPSSPIYLFSLWVFFALVIIESPDVKKSIASGAFVMEKEYDYLRGPPYSAGIF
jgi:hypothetical protein